MISAESLTEIGSILKTHGVKGELTVETPYASALLAGSCIVMDMDGIYVPFFINESRSRSGASCKIIIDGFSSDTEARALVGKHIYMPTDRLQQLLPPEEFPVDDDEDNIYFEDLPGFTLFDQSGNTVGTITDFDDSTANVVLSVTTTSQHNVYIPFAADLFIGIDFPSRTLTLFVPEGLLDI